MTVTNPINNLTDPTVIGSASMSNGDFLTFDALPNNKFQLIIPGLTNVQFFLQKFYLPDVKVSEVKINTRIVDYNAIGEKVEFSPFSVDFLVDKYMRNFAATFNWMKAMTVQGSNVDKMEDIKLLINGKECINFVDAWPTSLSGFKMDITESGVVYAKSTISFNYDYFSYVGDFATVDSSY